MNCCFGCRGVWFGRGELDKIIERANTSEHPKPKTTTSTAFLRRRENIISKNVTFLSDLFDFYNHWG
ncbi:zf-TFIIB domain-containing protein [Piscirickettsia salmonis]|uniref:TFIIB-type zinc ribbon-containing protein n=1 Tax=Piscirickettsia salmonis TaxID=1238 RepID=UPI0009BC021A|nr:hypothetical protein GW538_11305 [Piscirickettsia salmonis]QHS30616.1 hypothetical protein GW537_11450 [Piscirickettsia salmonis]